MTKIAITADLHIHKFAEFDRLNDRGVSSRLIDGINVLSTIRKYCILSSIRHVVIAGDLFHKRVVLDVETLNLTLDEIESYRRDGLQVWFLEGNHDQATKDGRIHALEAFTRTGAIVTGRSRLKMADVSVDFIPYCDDSQSVFRFLKSQNKTLGKAELVFMHHGFKGARVGSQLEYIVKEPLDSSRIIDFGYDFVFSGHYHTRQWLLPNMMYIGSPLEHTRSDKSDKEKGFLVYDTETKQVELVPIKAPYFMTRFADDWEKGPSVKGNFVDVILDDMHDAEEITKALFKAGARGVKAIFRPTPVKREKKRLDVDPTMSANRAIKKFVNWNVKNKKTDLNSDELIMVGKRILNEVE